VALPPLSRKGSALGEPADTPSLVRRLRSTVLRPSSKPTRSLVGRASMGAHGFLNLPAKTCPPKPLAEAEIGLHQLAPADHRVSKHVAPALRGHLAGDYAPSSSGTGGDFAARSRAGRAAVARPT